MEPGKPLHRLAGRAAFAPGLVEAAEAGRRLCAAGYGFDLAYTSVLRRAIKTLWVVLEELDLMWIPIEHRWQLNERHYGALTGLDKAETAARHGEEQVLVWRRSYDIPPPPFAPGDPRTPPATRATRPSPSASGR